MASNDTWSVATAEDDGKPIIFRIRNKPPSFASKKTFPHLLAVGWQYEPPNESGMPPEELADRMGQLEDLLEEAFEGACQAFLAVIATSRASQAANVVTGGYLGWIPAPIASILFGGKPKPRVSGIVDDAAEAAKDAGTTAAKGADGVAEVTGHPLGNVPNSKPSVGSVLNLPDDVAAQVDEAISRASQRHVRFPGHDGKPYLNRDGLLPTRSDYTEWTAAPSGARRGAHRIIFAGDPASPDAIYYWDHVNPPVQIWP